MKDRIKGDGRGDKKGGRRMEGKKKVGGIRKLSYILFVRKREKVQYILTIVLFVSEIKS